MIRSRIFRLTSSGTSTTGSISAPPSRFLGMYYQFTPDRGSADIDVRSLGRTVLTKQNATNANGFQEPTDAEPALVAGPVILDISGMQAGDAAYVEIFLDADY